MGGRGCLGTVMVGVPALWLRLGVGTVPLQGSPALDSRKSISHAKIQFSSTSKGAWQSLKCSYPPQLEINTSLCLCIYLWDLESAKECVDTGCAPSIAFPTRAINVHFSLITKG